MSVLKQKSEANAIAAQLLFSNQLHAPSVHCRYYGCAQLMLHIIFGPLRKDEATFQNELRERREKHHKMDGTHGHAIYVIDGALAQQRTKNQEAFDDYKEFRKLVYELKGLREDADYSTTAIDSSLGQKARDIAERVLRILKRRFTT